MEFVLDSSVLLRYIDITDVTINQFVIDLVEILEDPTFTIYLPPIIYAEVTTQAFFSTQRAIVHDFIELFEDGNLFTLIFEADKTILKTCRDIAKNYTASGGVDTLIAAWTKKLNAILLTLDDIQAKKAKSIHLECYDLTDGFNRRALLTRISVSMIRLIVN